MVRPYRRLLIRWRLVWRTSCAAPCRIWAHKRPMLSLRHSSICPSSGNRNSTMVLQATSASLVADRQKAPPKSSPACRITWPRRGLAVLAGSVCSDNTETDGDDSAQRATKTAIYSARHQMLLQNLGRIACRKLPDYRLCFRHRR